MRGLARNRRHTKYAMVATTRGKKRTKKISSPLASGFGGSPPVGAPVQTRSVTLKKIQLLGGGGCARAKQRYGSDIRYKKRPVAVDTRRPPVARSRGASEWRRSGTRRRGRRSPPPGGPPPQRPRCRPGWWGRCHCGIAAVVMPCADTPPNHQRLT